MTVQTLVKVQDQLKKDLEVVNSNCKLVEDKRADELSKLSNKYFQDILEEGDVIKVSSEKIEFTRPQEGYNYNKELVSLRFDPDWKTDIVGKVNTSFYSTSDNSEYELRRMILIGKVGQILLDFYDDILGEWNLVKAKYREELEPINKETFKLEKEIRSISDQIRDVEKQQLISKVENEGVEIELPEGKSINDLPNLDVKFDRTIYNIKGLQIISKTKSGKSADVRLKVLNNIWDQDTQSYNEKEQITVVEKVRMDNIERFLQYNSNKISAS